MCPSTPQKIKGWEINKLLGDTVKVGIKSGQRRATNSERNSQKRK
jgi:hypothetical protein